jgi:PAS domain S-box-containing protein
MGNEFSRLVNALPGLVWTALPDGHIDFLNQRWCQYTGLSLQEVIGWGWQTAIHSKDLPKLVERWQSILASGEPGEMEARLRRFDGEYRWFLISSNPMRDEAGQVVKWYGVNTDIEDRRRAEEALRLRELSFRLIVDSIPAPVAVTTPSGEVEGVNRPTLEYFGKTFEELKNWATASDVVHPDDLPHAVALQREAHEMGREYNVESRHRRADGVYRWFNVRGFPLRDTEGHILRWFILQIDIDDRKRAEALLAGEKRLLEMVAGGHSLSGILEALCKLVESTASGCYCSVVLVDPSGTRLEQVAAPSLPASFITSITGRPVNVDSGPSAMAAYLNEQVISTDLTSETRWLASEWCSMALAHGLKACLSTPISSKTGRVLGAFAIYYDTARMPMSAHQSLIERFTHIASIAIESGQREAELKRSEARKAAVLDSSVDCIVTIDHEGRITEFNPAAERTFGYRREEVVGRQLADVMIPPSLREAHRRGFVRYLATGGAAVLGRRVEMTAVRSDGSEFPVELAITRIPLDGPPSFTGYLRDITEHKRNENALREAHAQVARSEERWRSVFENSAIGVALTDLNGRFIATNPVYQEMLGYTGEELQKLSFLDITHEEYLEPNRTLIGELLAGNRQQFQIEKQYRRKNGSLVWVRNNVSVVPGTERVPRFLMALSEDITERKQAEEELRRSEAFLAEGQHLARVGSFSWHVTTDKITWSEELYRIFEFDRNVRVTFELIFTRIHREDLLAFKEQIERSRRDGSDVQLEFRLQMPKHSVKYVHVVARGTRDKDGRLEYIGAVQDVTQRRLSEEALAQAQSELAHVARVTSLGVLTASIAHEVRQPLSGIMTNANTCLRMLAADPPNVEGARETARRTIRDGNRASEVMTRLRALFSKKEPTPESMDLNEVHAR